MLIPQSKLYKYFISKVNLYQLFYIMKMFVYARVIDIVLFVGELWSTHLKKNMRG